MEPFDKEFINERIELTIEGLMELELDGCITGSCVLSNDFRDWETEPDVDWFAYSETSFNVAVGYVLGGDRYKIANKKEHWKFGRMKHGRNNSKNRWITQTMYIEDTHTGIYINMSHKPGTSNILDVLSRFDTVAIMVGICCRTRKKVDLRWAFHPEDHKFVSASIGDANPIRLWYMAEGWDEQTWSRELARIKKYDTRGFDMTGMAEDMIEVAARVLERGEVVGSEKSKARYLNLMLSCYRPVVWLEEFIESSEESIIDETKTPLSESIFKEIVKLIDGLSIDIQERILTDMTEPLIPTGDKEFIPDDEEEDMDDIPEDR